MVQYTLKDAQNQLKKLISEARSGKAIVILDEDNQAVQLVPVNPSPKQARKAGSARGLITMADDFDAPLSDFDKANE